MKIMKLQVILTKKIKLDGRTDNTITSRFRDIWSTPFYLVHRTTIYKGHTAKNSR